MYIITDKDDVIFYITETKNYQESGNLLVDNDTLAIAEYLVKGVFEIQEIPENVTVHKYCYTEEKGFYENENYVEPKKEVTVKELQQQITDLQLALVEIVEGGIQNV